MAQFGKSKLLSQEEYEQKINAPDTYGNLGRGPASADDSAIEEEADAVPPEVDDKSLAKTVDEDIDSPPTDDEEDPEQKKKIDKEIADESDDVEKELSDSEPKDATPQVADEDQLEGEPSPQGSHMLASLSMPALPGSAPAKNPQLDKYQQFIDQYKQLQNQRSKGDLVNGLLAAGGKIGQSMAGKFSGNFTPDQSGIQMLQKMNERPVQDFEQGQVVQGRGMQLKDMMDDHDANSSKSKLIREYLKNRLGMNLGDDVSAADAQNLLKTIGKPTQSHFQKVNGVATIDGQTKSMSAIFDPASGQYINPETRQVIPGFHAESLNPFQNVKDADTGQNTTFNKSTGGRNAPVAPHYAGIDNPNDFYAMLGKTNPNLRKEMQDKIIPDFNKLTQKPQERLMHEGPIMARLKEAKINPAAYAQLQAEMARFDVGDQRLAQQEFNMFAQRHGYQGFGDWVRKNSSGTINDSFEKDFSDAIGSTADSIRTELSKMAEQKAQAVISRLPKDQQVDVSVVAPLIYAGYKPHNGGSGDMIKVVSTKTGKSFLLPSNKVQEALEKKLIEDPNVKITGR